MAAKAPAAKTYETWLEIDRALSRLGTIEPEKVKHEADLAKRIQDAKDAVTPELSPLEKEIEAITLGLTAFLTAHRKDLGAGRSMTLRNGTVGLRLNPAKLMPVGGKNWTAAITQRVVDAARLLPKAIRDRIIRTKDDPNKDAIEELIGEKKLTEKQLAALGIQLIQEETAWYELAAESAVRS